MTVARWIGCACAWIVLALTASPQAAPQSVAGLGAREAFERGVQAWRGGDRESARSLWLAALDAPADARLDRAEVCYDLGNAAWRAQKPLEAAAWYTAAIRIDPRHADAWANLEFVRGAAGLEPADRGDLTATLRRLLSLLTLAESEWLVVICALAWSALLAAHALRGGVLLRRMAVVGGLVTAVSLVPWIDNLRRNGRDEVFVVAPAGAGLQSEPRGEATNLAHLAAGSIAQRLDSLPGWVQVRAGGDQPGWVREGDVFALRR